MEEKLIAPCGMNCGVCSRHLALRNDIGSKGIKMAYCSGCRQRNRQCAFIKKRCSLLLTGKVQYCYECKDFPCANLRKLDNRYKKNFRMSVIENLNYIKENGIEQFLNMEQEKWKCPQCGDIICCHNGVCFNCGLSKLREKTNKYRWVDG